MMRISIVFLDLFFKGKRPQTRVMSPRRQQANQQMIHGDACTAGYLLAGVHGIGFLTLVFNGKRTER